MKVLYDDCLDAIKNDKCSECNDYFQCSVSDYIEQRYQKGRADAINDVLNLGAHFWEIDGEFYIKVRDIYEMCISLAPQR